MAGSRRAKRAPRRYDPAAEAARPQSAERLTLRSASGALFRAQKRWGGRALRSRLARLRPPKGVGVRAARPITAGGLVAYYPIIVIRDPARLGAAWGPSHRHWPLRKYFIEVQDARGATSVSLLGVPDLATALKPPFRGAPHIGLWANEPTPRQRPNAALLGQRPKTALVEGAQLLYKVQATEDIPAGGEVMVCYGDQYDRGDPPYPTGC